MSKVPCILLVDDDSTTNFLSKLIIEQMEVATQILVAENGALGLRALGLYMEAHPGDRVLVFLDVNMPVLNGIEFLEAVQGLPLSEQQAVIIVMLTTSLHPRDLSRLHHLPVAGLVSKPLSKAKIALLLQEHFPPEQPAAGTTG